MTEIQKRKAQMKHQVSRLRVDLFRLSIESHRLMLAAERRLRPSAILAANVKLLNSSGRIHSIHAIALKNCNAKGFAIATVVMLG